MCNLSLLLYGLIITACVCVLCVCVSARMHVCNTFTNH
jgi:hypothetical protein